MSITAMKQALEALEVDAYVYNGEKSWRAITSLRQAISDLEKQDPVKIVQYNCVCGKQMKFESVNGVVAPKREWVGLTDEEKHKTWYEMQNIMGWYSFQEIAQAVEAKLKEKNT